MWEAIRQNRRRSAILIALMGAVLVLMGFAIGSMIDPRVGGIFGALIALAIWLIQLAVAFSGGDSILLASAHARRITKADAPQLFNVVEEMTIASGLKKMPAVYIMDSDELNAFAVGRNPEKAAVAVTAGLLRRLNRDELQGVIAHEIGHILNQDIRFMTIAIVMVGSIVLLSHLVWRGLLFGGRSRRSSRMDPRLMLIVVVVAIVVAIVAPIAAQLLYFACSRRREYLADATSARITRYPEGLASALEKIAGGAAKAKSSTNRALAPMYIINPLQARAAAGLASTHPPTDQRIKILRSMAGGAGYVDYAQAAKRAGRSRESAFLVGLAEKEGAGKVQARGPSADAARSREAKVGRLRQVNDILDRYAGFLFLACACGVRIKVPPNYKGDSIRCVRCGTVHPVPKGKARKVP